MHDTEIAGSLEISGANKEQASQVIRAIQARFIVAMDVCDVYFPIVSASDHLTRTAFWATVIGRDQTEAREWIETLCREALKPFDRPDPPFRAVVKLEVHAPSL